MTGYKILVVHGPNLNLLGEREPEIYGSTTLPQINRMLHDDTRALGIAELRCFQSNHEGALVDTLQQARHWMDGALINPAAYTHTSVALRDVIAAIAPPVVEVHLSDPSTRETFRHHSFVKDVCLTTVAGKGANSYREGLATLIAHLNATQGVPPTDVATKRSSDDRSPEENP